MAQYKTVQDQRACEQSCCRYFVDFASLDEEHAAWLQADNVLNEARQPCLIREAHVRYLTKGLKGLGPSYVSLDASRPWLLYWILHALDVLGALPFEVARGAIETVSACQDRAAGGFGGGPLQLSHCAPTYAAVLALCILGTEAAYEAIDRRALYKFFMSMKHTSGGFRMHQDGEVDVRGTYTVICIAALLNLLTPELVHGAADYAHSCQNYEGGFGGEPHAEAHGGYVFCAIAALWILDSTDDIRLDALEKWLAHRQLRIEGGFQGRTNKLVDGCYSFWQGGSCALAEDIRERRRNPSAEHTLRWRRLPGDDAFDQGALDVSSRGDTPDTIFDVLELQKYILLCCQEYPDGGLRDKPGKPRDYYHSCYCLSGLAVAQHLGGAPLVYGDPANLVEPVHPAFNIRIEKVDKALEYFANRPSTHAELTD